MKNTMRKGILFLAFVVLVAGGVFAQRVGDTVQLGGETWIVQSISGDTATIRKAPGLDGTWKFGTGSGGSFTINTRTGTGVYAIIDSSSAWQNAVREGIVKVGDVGLRNLTKTGDLTWSAQMQRLSGSRLDWIDITFTLSADGQTFRDRFGTWYRQ